MRRNTLKTDHHLKKIHHQKKLHTDAHINPQTNAIDNFQSLNTNPAVSLYIASQLINQTLIQNVIFEVNQKQLKKLIRHAMNQCAELFQNQNWQIDSIGPAQQKKQQAPILSDQQPQSLIFDPMLQKHKNPTEISKQNLNSLILSKRGSILLQKKSTNLHSNTSRKSIRSNQPRLSKFNFTPENPKLIPLRFQNGITPELSTRRTLQDFLREKKTNADVNLGYKIRNFSQDKQNLKTIMEFPKSNIYMNTTRNFPSSQQSEIKLPQLHTKQQFNTDYDGNSIQIKKISHLSKKAQILKLLCKVKQENEDRKKSDIHSKHYKPEQIRLNPLKNKKQTLNSTTLTTRLNDEEDMRSLIENGLLTNRVKFSYLTQKQIEENHLVAQNKLSG